jgi:hypothetical protein
MLQKFLAYESVTRISAASEELFTVPGESRLRRPPEKTPDNNQVTAQTGT